MRLRSILLDRAEGPSALCGPAPAVSSWEAADNILREWSHTAPQTGGYDKCDFTLVFENLDGQDFSYKGRYDLKHWKCEHASLQQQMRETALFALGALRPSHMDEAKYQSVLENYYDDENTKQFYAELFATGGILEVEPETEEEWRTQAHHAYILRTLDDGSIAGYVWTDDDEDHGTPSSCASWDVEYQDRADMDKSLGKTHYGVSGVSVLVLLDNKVIY